MNIQVAPTKGNLLTSKKSLEFAKMGFDLLDKKRNILVREMMTLIDHASKIQSKIDDAYSDAYRSLQIANVTLGICRQVAESVPEEDSLILSYRSVMGVEIPIVSIDREPDKNYVPVDLQTTNSPLDNAYLKFREVKQLTAELSEIENSVYRLADSIKKTQKRANALKNVMIPRFEETIKIISSVLEENSRDTFSNLKILKDRKQKANK